MPFERELRTIEYKDASEVLGEQPLPFNKSSEPKHTSNGSVRVTLQYPSQGFEPMYIDGEAKIEDGKTPEQVLFEAYQSAANLRSTDVTYLDHSVEDDGVAVRFLDSEGLPWKATGADIDSATITGLAALKKSRHK